MSKLKETLKLLKPFHVIYVAWKDAQTMPDSLIMTEIETEGLVNVKSVGFFLNINNERIALAPWKLTYKETEPGAEPSYKNTIYIPITQITEIEVLKHE